MEGDEKCHHPSDGKNLGAKNSARNLDTPFGEISTLHICIARTEMYANGIDFEARAKKLTSKFRCCEVVGPTATITQNILQHNWQHVQQGDRHSA